MSSRSTEAGGPAGASSPGRAGATAIAPGDAPGRPPLPPSFLHRPFAHRGLHDPRAGRIENGMSAFDAAVAAGYGIELDVQLSSDGEAVVFHDATLDRLTAQDGPLLARTAAQLAGIRLGTTRDRIPRLSEVLARVGGRVPVLVELKDQSGDLGESDGRLEAAVSRGVAGHAGPVALMSFSPAIVARLAEVAADVPRGLASDAFAPEDWPGVALPRLEALRRIDVGSAGAAFVSHDRRDLAAPRIRALRSAGLPVVTWTIRSPAEAAEALTRADAITFEGYRPTPAPAPAADA